MRFTSSGFSGVRREVTTQRKELAILNSQLRAVTKKVDDIAVLADRLTASLIFQRRTLVTMAADISAVVTSVAADRRALAAPVAGATPDAAAAAATSGLRTGAPISMDERDAQWVLDLKVRGPSSPCLCQSAPVSNSFVLCARWM